MFTFVKQLLRRFGSPELVRKFVADLVTIVQIKKQASKTFLGFLLGSILNELLDKGDIKERNFDIFHKSVLEFHCTASIYAMNNFALQDEFFAANMILEFL